MTGWFAFGPERTRGTSSALVLGLVFAVGCSDGADATQAAGTSTADGSGAADDATASTDAGKTARDASEIIEELRVEDIAAQRAVVRFDTSIATTCQVEFGLAEDALEFGATDPSMDPEDPYSTDHEVPLEDLMPDTEYFYRARVEDPEGNVTYSDVFSFSTTELPAGETLRENIALQSAGSSIIDVSSNYGGGDNDSSWGVHNAIDGKMATEWATDGDGDDAYFVLDFGSQHRVEAFAFRSRKMSDGSSIISQFTLTFDDGDPLGPFVAPSPDQVYKFALEEPVSAEQVRFQAVKTTGGNTGARELQLFAAASE